MGDPRTVRMLVTIALVASALVAASAPASSSSHVSTQRLAGVDRYATAAAGATVAYPSGSSAVVLASGQNFPDGLAAAYLSGAASAPLLLTARDELPAATLNSLAALLGPSGGTVHVVGGQAAIGTGVRQQLTQLGYTLNEIGGPNRYQTAANVAVVGNGIGGVGSFGGKRTAIVTTGANFPDALSAGALAQRGRHPVLLTTPGSLSPEAEVALTGLAIERVLVMGGTGAVSASVEAAIVAKGIEVVRVAGANRNATAAELALLLTTPSQIGGFGWNGRQFVLARGATFPDALAASQVGGRLFAPILLTASGLPPESRRLMHIWAQELELIYVMGGGGAVPEAVVQQAVSAATTEAITATVTFVGSSDMNVTFSEPVQNAALWENPPHDRNYLVNWVNDIYLAEPKGVGGMSESPCCTSIGILRNTSWVPGQVVMINPPGGSIRSPDGRPASVTRVTVPGDNPPTG